MRLTRRQLRNELRTLEAQHRADSAVISSLMAEVQRLQEAPALIDNIRLAHQLEQLEAEIATERAMRAVEHLRIARFMHDHPDLFREMS